MPIELVVFDMAGTTVYDDDAVNICLRRALLDAGVAVDRESVNDVMGEAKPVAIAKLLNRVRGTAVPSDDAEVGDIYAAFERLMLEFYLYDPGVRASDGADEVFAALQQRGVRVALDTGFNRLIADAILKRLKWYGSDLVDATVTS